MDVQSIFEAGGTVIKNPNYSKSKKNTEPEYITVSDLNRGIQPTGSAVADFVYNAAAQGNQDILGRNGELDKYIKNGLTPNDWDNTLDAQLAATQSNWTKLGNGLAQAVVSEVGLGTIGALSDIADYLLSNILHITERDYQNPVSTKIAEWQDKFNNEVAPVFVDPNVDIQNGGLANFGWYCKNIPNIASTLMLLLPAKGISLAAGAMIKGSKLARGIGNARRWVTGINKLEDASQMAHWQAAINSFEGVARANKAVEIGAEALLMRTAENYQEARETYMPVYKEASETFNGMTDEEIQALVESNPNFFDKNKVDTKNRDELAKYVARSAADRTYTMDFTNIIFDIIQLYGLRNMGKGIKEVKRSSKINTMQQEAIDAAGEIKPLSQAASATAAKTASKATTESLGFLDKVGAYGKRAGGAISTFGKYQGKTILAESTEGIEEAVNYIAQQEGLTYGKMLLAGQTDAYTDSWWTAIPKTWTNMQGNLGDYLLTPELQESAFWGVAGGLVFGNLGSAANKVQLAFERKAEAKLRKENEKTGESTPLDRITALFESNEDKVVRMVMQKRLDNFNLLAERLRTIENGRDPFSELGEDKQYKEFVGDKEARAAVARARAIYDFRSSLAIDAVNSGTYDLLTEYIKSKEVKQAMVNLGLATEEEVDSFVQATLNDMEDAKREYARQSAFVLNQVSFINNQKKKYKGKDENIGDDSTDIPVEYARIIAEENYIRARTVKTIEQQLASLGVLESEQEAILAELNPDINPLNAKDAVALGALLSTYRELAVQEKEVNAKEANNSLAKLQKFSLLEQIKNQKEAVLKEIKKRGIGGNVRSTGNIFTAFSIGKRSQRNADTKKIEETIKVTDAEILKDVRAFFGDEMKDVSDEAIIQEAKALSSDMNSFINDKSDGLIKLNSKLFELYSNRIQLEIQKELQRSLISKNQNQILERINYHHNLQNEVRAAKVSVAESVIRRAIEEYSGIIDENNGADLVPAIVAAYQGNRSEAKRIAEQVMASPGEGAVTASEFIDALDIMALHRKSNKTLYDWMLAVINERANLIRQERTRRIQENATSKNDESATENDGSINSSSEQSKSPTRNPIASEGNQSVGTKLVINKRGKIVSAKVINSGQANNSNTIFNSRRNEDGTIEIIADNMSKDKQLTLISAGLFDVEGDIDPLAPGEQWEVTENPIVKIRQNKPIEIVKLGTISKVNNEETGTEEATEKTVETNNTPEKNPAVIDNYNSNDDTGNEEEPGEIEEEVKQAPDSTPVEGNDAINQAKPDNNPSTGGVAYQEGEITNLNDDINTEIFSNIPDLLADNINFDEIATKVIDKISEKYPSISKEDIKTNVDRLINNTKAASESAKKFSSSVLQTGVSLLYNSKVEDSTASSFSKLFEAAAEAFLKEYSKLLITKEIDGKQVVRLEDIMRLITKAWPISKAEAASFYELIRSYLIANQSRFVILDLNEGEKIFDRLDKTSEEVVKQEYGDAVRVNIRDFIETEPGDKYFEVLDNLKVGDKVKLTLDKNRIYVSANGQNIGYMIIPRVDGDAYIQENQGWVTDVKLDANGSPVSEVMDIIKRLFLTKDINHDKLRTLLTRLSVNPDNITEDDVEEFSLNPAIAYLVKQAKTLHNNGKKRTILKVNKDGTINLKEPLLHLVRLWKYTNTSNIATNREDIEKTISINLISFYNRLYKNYQVISNLSGNEEAIVTKKSGTRAVKVFEDDTFNNYNELPLAGDVIVNKEVARISIGNKSTTNNISISGRPNINQEGFKPGSTFLTMFGTDGNIDFIKAYGVRLSDPAMMSNQVFRNLGRAAFNYFETILHKLFAPRLGTTSTEEIENFLNALVATNGNANTIPLFRAIRGEFQIEPFAYDKSSATGIKLVYFEKGKAPVRFFIYNNDVYGTKPFGFKVEDGNKSVKFTTTNTTVSESEAIRKCREALFNFLAPRCNFNIDTKAIEADSLSDTNYDGFINRKNNKLIIDIPNESNPDAALHEEFDSYNDFLIDTNLIRVNTKKSKNGTNFERFGENQRANSNLFISLPKKSESTINTTTEIKTEQGTLKEDYNSFIDTFENGKASSEQVIDAILTEEDKTKLTDAVEGENLHITDLFPQTIEFVPEFNDYNLDNIGSQPIAATSGNRDKFNLPIYKNGTVTSTTRRGANRTFVGPKFANMAASSLKARRYNAIKTLMHERIHNILQNKSDKSKTLLEELEDVYNEFVSLVREDIKNKTINAEDAKILSSLIYVYNKELAKHKELLSKGNPASFRHVEEFLVDSLTNSVLYNYLNSKQVENAKDNGKPENLLTKIINAICKFFGWNPATDGSLFMRELNVIKDIYKDSEEVISKTEEIQQPVIKKDNAETKIKESENLDLIDEDDLGSALDEDERALLDEDETNEDGVDFSTVEDVLNNSNSATIESTYTQEMKSIKDKAIADGTFMKAPKGQPTNLNERQWLQVRTEAFKNWFGDWINDPENASKVVDENGEPLVVYHATKANFSIFDKNFFGTGSGNKTNTDGVFYFSAHKETAIDVFKPQSKEELESYNVISVFLNIKNANIVPLEEFNRSFNDETVIPRLLNNKDGIIGVPKETPEQIYERKLREYNTKKENGTLGMFDRKPNSINDFLEEQLDTVYVTIASNQIKSATSNNGEFSVNDDDINYSTVEDSYETNDGFIMVGNIDAFGNQLPIEQTARYNELVAQGVIQTKCH